VYMAENLIAFMCRLSWNLGASNPWNPQGLSTPVMDALPLPLYSCILLNTFIITLHSQLLYLYSANSRFSQKLRKTTISFVMSNHLSVCLSVRLSVCPSLRMEQLDFLYKYFHEILYFNIFRTLSRKFWLH
jgi:hypothetical protein